MKTKIENKLNEVVPVHTRKNIKDIAEIGFTDIRETVERASNNRVTTTVYVGNYDGREYIICGTAVCHHDDKIDPRIGLEISRIKAYKEAQAIIGRLKAKNSKKLYNTLVIKNS